MVRESLNEENNDLGSRIDFKKWIERALELTMD
jgi:hypothetical protein